MESTTPNPTTAGPQTPSQGTPAPAATAPTTQSTTQKLWGPQTTTPPAAIPASQAQVSVPATGTAPVATPQAVQPSATAPSTQPAAAVATTQPGVVQMTPELLTQAVAAAVKAGQPVAPPPTPTQEEFEKMFNVVKPSRDQWAAVRGDNEEQALAALTQLLQGAVKQASTIASYQMATELEELRKQFNPALSYAQEQETIKLKEEFLTAYPDLKGMDPLLYTIRDQFILNKRTFPNKEAAFKAIAETAQGMLKNIPALGGGGQPTGGGAPAAVTAPTTLAMPTLSGRGVSGAGDGGASNPKVSTTKRIFGPQP